MNSRRPDDGTRRMSYGSISRRHLLAMTGVVAAGGLSGCVSQVASRVTNTGASPAAVFAGTDWNDDETEVTFTPHVARLTPTVSGGSGLLSGEVELEAWVTSVVLEDYNSPRSNRSIANPDVDSDDDGVDDGVGDHDDNDVRGEDYNSTRSNRSIARPSDFFDDDIDEGDELSRRVSRLDARLQEATTAAATAISKRSAKTGRNPETEKEITEAVSEMETVLADMRAMLERCSDESCVAALANVADRQADVRRAQEYAENGEWEAFGLTDGGGDRTDILVGDYLLPPLTFDPSGMFSAAEQAALFRYFESNPVVAERFSVCLPDAEVPGGNGSIREAVTPERLFAYLAGQAGEGTVYAWGASRVASEHSGDCDDSDDERYPGAVCGTSPHFVADVSEPVETGGGLMAVRGADGHVVVTNTPPTVTDGASAMVCPVEGEPFEPAGLDAWGKTKSDVPVVITQEGRLSAATVVQVTVQPPGCPEPFPALLYVSRGLSDGQLIYSGGWIIDDAALYGGSSTVLSMAGATQVVGVDASAFGGDLDGDGSGDVVSRAVSRGIDKKDIRRGARIASGTVDELVEVGVVPEGGKESYDTMIRKKPGGRASGDDGEPGESHRLVTHCPLDAPVLHLMNAGDASSEVKFKAGAELSKSVN